jgi:hypothetical protein
MVHMVMKIKFGINKYSQVFNRVGPSYGGLSEFIIIDQYFGLPGEIITSVSLLMSFIQLAVHQPCTELMSDCSRF